MNSNVRIGLCVLGFFMTSAFVNFSIESGLIGLEGVHIILIPGFIIATIIYVVTGDLVTKLLSPPSTIEKQIDSTAVILLYILSFFIPLAGFIVGAIYSSKEEEHYKHVGKNCLKVSTLNVVIGIITVASLFV